MPAKKRALVRLHVTFVATTNREIVEKVARLRVAGMTIDTSYYGLGAVNIGYPQEHTHLARGETAATNLDALRTLSGYTLFAEVRSPPIQ